MMGSHRSLFHYTVTKPYPYRWFTPVTIAGAIILTAICSWLNYASNGFEMSVMTSADPNATIADPGVLRGLPTALTSKYRPTCEPANINVNSQFYTNNSGLEYKVLGLLQHKPNASVVLPVFAYNNNVLENCSIFSIQLELSWSDRSGIQLAISEYGTIVRTYATCNISTSEGIVTLGIANAYNLVPPSIAIEGSQDTEKKMHFTSSFVSSDANNKASLWWGQSLLSCYWIWFVSRMSLQHHPKGGAIRTTKGWLAFHPAFDGNATSILDQHFFHLDWRLINLTPSGNHTTDWPHSQGYQYASTLHDSNTYPSTWWLPAEKLAKSAWSTILVDLGQSDQSNVLLDDRLLEQFSSDLVNKSNNGTSLNFPGPENLPYNVSHHDTGPLGTSPAVIAMEYICNVPHRKATSTIIWSVLVADLVFLQAAWTIFKLIVEHFLVKKRKNHNNDGTNSEYSFDSVGKTRRVQTV